MQTQDEINEDNKRAFEAARAASARAADLEVAFAALYRFVDCLPTAMQDLVKPDEWAAICRLKGYEVEDEDEDEDDDAADEVDT